MALTVAVSHSTPADGTFSAAGALAWNAAHTATVSGVASSSQGGTGSAFFAVAGPSVLRTYTFPDANATMAYGAITDLTVPMGNNAASATPGQLQDSLLTYSATYTGVNNDKVAHPSFAATGAGFTASQTRTATTNGGFACGQFIVNVSPTANQTGTDSTAALQISCIIPGSATKDVVFMTGLDSFNFVNAAVNLVASVAVSGWSALQAGATASAGMIGGVFTANQTHASATSAQNAGIVVDMTNGVTVRGSIGTLYGINISDVNFGSATVTGDRAAIRIAAMTGTPGGVDYAIFSEATQISQLYGSLALGHASTTSGSLTLLHASHANSVTISPSSSMTGSYNVNLPVSNSLGLLMNNGSGVTSWKDAVSQMGATLSGSAPGATTTSYSSPGSNSLNTTEAVRQYPMPFDCTLADFAFATATSQPASGNMVVTIRKNGAGTALTKTVVANDAAQAYNDNTHTVAFLKNDLFSVEFANAASAGSAAVYGWSVRVRPT